MSPCRSWPSPSPSCAARAARARRQRRDSRRRVRPPTSPRPPSSFTGCCPTAATPTGRARSTTRCRRTSSSATSRRSTPGSCSSPRRTSPSSSRTRTKLDDAIKGGDLSAPYAMFALYKQRVDERSAYARGLLQAGQLRFHRQRALDYDRERRAVGRRTSRARHDVEAVGAATTGCA